MALDAAHQRSLFSLLDSRMRCKMQCDAMRSWRVNLLVPGQGACEVCVAIIECIMKVCLAIIECIIMKVQGVIQIYWCLNAQKHDESELEQHRHAAVLHNRHMALAHSPN